MKKTEIKQVEETNKRPDENQPYYDELSKSWYECKEVNENKTLPFALFIVVFISVIILAKIVLTITK
jgi:hypothetical protein